MRGIVLPLDRPTGVYWSMFVPPRVCSFVAHSCLCSCSCLSRAYHFLQSLVLLAILVRCLLPCVCSPFVLSRYVFVCSVPSSALHCSSRVMPLTDFCGTNALRTRHASQAYVYVFGERIHDRCHSCKICSATCPSAWRKAAAKLSLRRALDTESRSFLRWSEDVHVHDVSHKKSVLLRFNRTHSGSLVCF